MLESQGVYERRDSYSIDSSCESTRPAETEASCLKLSYIEFASSPYAAQQQTEVLWSHAPIARKQQQAQLIHKIAEAAAY